MLFLSHSTVRKFYEFVALLPSFEELDEVLRISVFLSFLSICSTCFS